MDEQSDALIVQLSDDSREAFTAIYDVYFPGLLGFAMSLLGCRQDAEDVCADVFTNLWMMRRRFSTIKNVRAFLYVSVRNNCLNLMKSAQVKRRGKISVDQLEQIGEEGIEDIRTEYKILLAKEIDRLPAQCQCILKLAYYEEKSNDEIAGILGISKQTVINQKVRAKQLLRANRAVIISILSIAFAISVTFFL